MSSSANNSQCVSRHRYTYRYAVGDGGHEHLGILIGNAGCGDCGHRRRRGCAHVVGQARNLLRADPTDQSANGWTTMSFRVNSHSSDPWETLS